MVVALSTSADAASQTRRVAQESFGSISPFWPRADHFPVYPDKRTFRSRSALRKSQQRVRWVERKRYPSIAFYGDDGFRGGSTHPTSMEDKSEHRSPDGAKRNPGFTRHRSRIARSLSSGGASRRPVGCVPSMIDSLEVKVLYPA